MIKIALIVMVQLVLSGAFAKTEDESPAKVISQSIDYYNNQKYSESLSLLESIKSSRNQYISWYYYYALNQTRLNNYEEALVNFENYIKNTNVDNTAKAYYYMGLIQFYKGEYEKAINSLELSLDVSNNSQLDNVTEALIEKAIRYQNYYENRKKTNIGILLGYNFDSNAINLSQDSFDDNLNGHVFGYGISIAHKFIDKYSFIFEPTFAILDNYTFDSKFKANSTLQSTDALQILISAPIRFYFEEEKFSNKFDISLNAYNVYLPITTAARELSLTSVFLKAQILTPYSTDFSIKYNATVAADRSYHYSSEDDEATGLRFEFLTTFVQYLSKKDITNIFYDLGIDYSSTSGINTRYKKYSTAMGYMYPSFINTLSSVRLGYHNLNYSDKAVPRTDNQVNLSYNITKDLTSGAVVGLSIGAVSNSSNTDINKYSDEVAGLQYVKSIEF